MTIATLMMIKFVADVTYFNNYDPDLPFHARIASVEKKVDEETDLPYRLEKVYFEARPGEEIPTLISFPIDAAEPVPCIVFLHGIGQKKEFLNRICAPFNNAGFAMACFDQHMQGERKVDGNPVAQVVAFRQRPWKTVNDTRRLIDYLETRGDIDAERMYLVGASYGAITGSTATAFDKRIDAAVLVYGGGNIPKMLEAPMIRDEVGGALALLKPIVSFIMRPADPVRYVHMISPRPVLFQNGSRDRLVSPEGGKALQEAAREPKDITWYDSDHIGLDPDVVRQVLDEDLKWLLERDKPFREEEPEEQGQSTRSQTRLGQSLTPELPAAA